MQVSFNSPFSFNINPAHWQRLLEESKDKHLELCQAIFQIADQLNTRPIPTLKPSDQPAIDSLTNLLLSTIAHPALRVPDSAAPRFVMLNVTLSSLAALSTFKTTDTFLKSVMAQQNNYIRLLALYSARNTIHIDPALLFNINPDVASLWLVQVAQVFHGGLPSQTILNNLRSLYQSPATQFTPALNMPEPFFGSTYIDGRCDQLFKPHINRAIQTHFAANPLPANAATPNPKKIALISTLWQKNHSVYRIYADLLTSLKPHYHLTFFQIGQYAKQQTDLFDEVHHIESTNGFPNPAPLLNNNFQVIIYPDVGMANESIILANLRLAPIQIALLGHSVSTWGATIDYFISGKEVEIPLAENPEQNYSERLVLLPGMGCSHNLPEFTSPTSRELIEPPALTSPSDPLIISLPCNSHKFNAPFVATLAKLRRACSRNVRFRLFVGMNPLLTCDLNPFRQHLADALGADSVEVIPNLPYNLYLAALGQSHFCLDTHHFGGCNTVSDSLFMRTPMLCWQGTKWYNRIGPAMLRRAGLPELVATSESEYLATAHRLIHDDPFRTSLRTRLLQTNLTPALYSADDAPHFRRAIDYLIQNHPTLQKSPTRAPIYI